MTPERDVLYLSAPVVALVEGIFQAQTTIGDIKRHGDFALGTFNQLDGELVMVDGEAYQVTGDGIVHPALDETGSPFAVATFFQELSHDELPSGFSTLEDLFHQLDQLLPSTNIMYALRVEACFSVVRTRSVPRQELYRPLVEITRDQPTFERKEVQGTLAGFYTPPFMASLNVPGYHLHFLSADRTFGGHLLQCSASHAVVQVQLLRRLHMDLPVSLAFLTAEFVRNTTQDLELAEKEQEPKTTMADSETHVARITLKNGLEEITRLAMWMEEQEESLGLSPDMAMTLNLALEEWIVNVISYAYGDDAEHAIEVQLALHGQEVVVAVSDDGRPFDPTRHAEPDTSAPIEERPIGGLGIHFIRKTMDAFSYRRVDGHNIVTMVKHIAGDEEAS